jgi:hypothetical protein
VIAAIAADPALSRRQKQILREIYESFRAETAAAAPTTSTASGRPTEDPDEANDPNHPADQTG